MNMDVKGECAVRGKQGSKGSFRYAPFKRLMIVPEALELYFPLSQALV